MIGAHQTTSADRFFTPEDALIGPERKERGDTTGDSGRSKRIPVITWYEPQRC